MYLKGMDYYPIVITFQLLILFHLHHEVILVEAALDKEDKNTAHWYFAASL